MLADLELVDEIARGAAPTLRLYRWRQPTLSLDHFQADSDVDHAACTRLGVEVVRRPTGGQALLHGGDLTYAAVLPRPTGPAGRVDALYNWLARGLIAGLERLGVPARVARNDGPTGPVCFAGQQGADLRVGDRKVCGSAQVRKAGVVLQHGSILLHRLPFDETDLIEGSHDRADLHAATVTLEELGAAHEPHVVADALAVGFTATLGLPTS